jgi:transcriptional regulator with XRE-family HTH domain
LVSESSVLQALAARIKYYRGQKGWSQEQLAARACLNRTYLAAIERAARNPSIRTIAKLAIAFRVPFTAMFEQIPPQTDAAEQSSAAKRKRTRPARS